MTDTAVDAALANRHIIAYCDTETDGLKMPRRLLSISFKIGGTMHNFYAMPPGNEECGTKYNNWLTRERLESLGAGPFPQMWREVQASLPILFSGARVTIVAHNAKFDRGVVEGECMAHGIPAPDWRWADTYAMFKASGLDRVALTPSGKTRPSYTLGNVYRVMFGEGFEDAHSSDADTEALARCVEDGLRYRGDFSEWVI